MAGPTGTNATRPTRPAATPAARRPAPAASAAAPAAPSSSASTAPTTTPATVVVQAQPPVAAPAAPAAPRENDALLFGMLVVLGGFIAVLIALWIVVINYSKTGDATAVLGSITTAIGVLGGAFVGFAIGQQGVANANKQRNIAEASKDEAQLRTIKFAANMDPTVARRLIE